MNDAADEPRMGDRFEKVAFSISASAAPIGSVCIIEEIESGSHSVYYTVVYDPLPAGMKNRKYWYPKEDWLKSFRPLAIEPTEDPSWANELILNDP